MYATQPAIAPERAQGPPPVASATGEEALEEAASRLGAALDAALAHAPGPLSADLLRDPTLADLRAALAGLGPGRVLPVLHRLASPVLPARREVLEAVLAGDPFAPGKPPRATLQDLHRRALLARIFHPDRVQALRRACRTFAQETT